MSFNTNPGRTAYTATASQTAFPFVFKIYKTSDIKVYQTPIGDNPDDTADLLTLTTDYTVSIDGDAGGEITLVSGATLNDTITLVRELPVERDIEYQTSGDLLAETLNEDQEYQTYMILDGFTVLDNRTLLVPNTDTVDNNLPASVPNAALFVKTDGTGFEYRTADEVAAALSAWNAEAEALTADSYATEPEDVFVKVYTSDGDGTFTATDTTEYSALHWAAKTSGMQNLIDDTTPQLGGDLDYNGKTANKSAVRQISDDSLGTGTHTFNYTNGDMQQLTATGNITLAFSNFPSGDVAGFIVDCINFGAHTITHPAGMLFAGGVAPTYTTSGIDRIMVMKDKDDVLTLTMVAQDIKV